MSGRLDTREKGYIVGTIVLDNGDRRVEAIVDSDTREVKFPGAVITGNMDMIQSGRWHVEIVERNGRYYLEPAE